MVEATGQRFEVLAPLGKDALGDIVKARDTRDGAFVALKLFRPQIVSHLTRERFLDEFRALSAVVHPHLVRALEQGQGARTGQPWFTMELADGDDLRDWTSASRPAGGGPGWEAYERRVCT